MKNIADLVMKKEVKRYIEENFGFPNYTMKQIWKKCQRSIHCQISLALVQEVCQELTSDM